MILLLSTLLAPTAYADYVFVGRNHCANSLDRDIPQVKQPGIKTKAECADICGRTFGCTGFEWYDSNWGGARCHTVVGAAMAKTGKRRRDAQCFVNLSGFTHDGDNSCANSKDVDIKQVVQKGVSSRKACADKCNLITGCTGFEWYDSKWGGSGCHTVVGAAMAKTGKRRLDAQCYVRSDYEWVGDNHCADYTDKDIPQVVRKGIKNKKDCGDLCDTIKDCTGFEWYDSKWGGGSCHTVVRAAMAKTGKRRLDAKCYVKKSEYAKSGNNFCADNTDKDIPEDNQPFITTRAQCGMLCDTISGCTGYEWYNKKWNGARCHTVVGAAMAKTGKRRRDAECYIRNDFDFVGANSCANINDKDIHQKKQPGVQTKQKCGLTCNSIPGCTGYEWYGSRWNGAYCHTVVGAAMAKTGKRWQDAQCFVKTSNDPCVGKRDLLDSASCRVFASGGSCQAGFQFMCDRSCCVQSVFTG